MRAKALLQDELTAAAYFDSGELLVVWAHDYYCYTVEADLATEADLPSTVEERLAHQQVADTAHDSVLLSREVQEELSLLVLVDGPIGRFTAEFRQVNIKLWFCELISNCNLFKHADRQRAESSKCLSDFVADIFRRSNQHSLDYFAL